jgi:hypothetical protein
VHALVLSGGIFHDFDAAVAALCDVLAAAGFTTAVTEDVDAAFAAAGSGGEVDLLVVYALRWGMSQHEKYEPYRARWTYHTSPAARAGVAAHLARGGGLLGLHTASICFDDWPEWGATLGAGWTWGRSFHPPPAPLDVKPRAGAHVITRGAIDFRVEDELYQDLAVAPDATVLWSARAADGAVDVPVAFAREAGRARIVYDALGHDAASIAEPGHARLLARSAAWCVRRDPGEHGA